MAKVWRNRIEAGTQKLADCPARYRTGVLGMIREDIRNGVFTTAQLGQLVERGTITRDEYEEITGDPYDG